MILAAVTICRGAQSGHTGTLTAEAIAHAINHKEKLECTSTKGITRTLDVVTDEMFVEAPKPSCSATGCWFPQKIEPTRLRDAAGNMCTSRDSGKLIGDQFPESMRAKIMKGEPPGPPESWNDGGDDRPNASGGTASDDSDAAPEGGVPKPA